MTTAEEIVGQMRREQERYDRGEPAAKPQIDWARQRGYLPPIPNGDETLHRDVLAILDHAAVAAHGTPPTGSPARLTAVPDLGADAPKLRWLDVARMVREDPPEIPWRVTDVLADGALTMVFGAPGEGKSLLAAALSVAVAT